MSQLPGWLKCYKGWGIQWGWGGVRGEGYSVTHLLSEITIPALLMMGFIPYMSQLPGWLKCYKGWGIKWGGVGEGGGVFIVTHLLPEIEVPALLMLGFIPYMSQLCLAGLNVIKVGWGW